MELAPAAVDLTFEVTYDNPSLNVGMSVYNTTTGTPVLVSGPTAMVNVVGNTYIGFFNAAVEQTYLIYKAVYTDGTLTVLSTNYSAGTESIVAEDIGGGSGGGGGGTGAVIGIVEPTQTVIGIVQC